MLRVGLGRGWFWSLSIVLFISVLSACNGDDGAMGPADVRSEQSEARIETSTERQRDRRRAASGSLEGRIEDARLTSRVLIALADDDLLRRYPFEAEAIDGRVYVRGEVPTVALRRRIDDVLSAVSGVRSVVNETVSDEPMPEPPPIAADEPDPEPDEEAIAEAAPEPESRPVETEPAPPPAAAETHHTVRSGESLWTIARQYNTSVAEIRRLNSMSSDNLRPGQRIRVR